MRPVVSRAGPYAAVALAACVWGTWSLWLRRAEAIAPMPATLESTIVMGVITMVAWAVSARDRLAVPASWSARAWVVWLGIGDALNVLLFFAAYKITIGISVLTHYLTPIFVAIAAPIALRERLTIRTAVAVSGAFSGLALMLLPTHGVHDLSGAWQSAALGAGSAVFYASNVVVNKFVADTFSTGETMFWHGVVATPLLALFVRRADWATVDPYAVAFLATASIVPGALAGLAFVWGLRRMPAAHASALTLLEPLIAVLIGSAVFGEKLGWRTLAGGGLILACAFTVMMHPAGVVSAQRS